MDSRPGMQLETIQDALAGFDDLTVLVVGDFMLDCFVYGDLERISPEAPIPILRGSDRRQMLGGGGNVVANLVALGATALPLTVVGGDAAGGDLTGMLKELGVDTKGVLADKDRRTSQKTRFVAQRQQVLRFDEEDRIPLEDGDRATLFKRLERLLARANVVILSDYGKGVLGQGVAAEIISRCRAAEIPVLVDPKGDDYGIYAGATAVTPNRKELAEASGAPAVTDEEVEQAARQLVAAHRFDYVVATRSEDGMSLVGPDFAHHVATPVQEVFDVSGAGDTVIASFALGLAAGLDLQAAGALANAAAGVVVAKAGTAQVTRDELLVHMNGHVGKAGAVDLDHARRLVASWKSRDLTVGFTNGCFDILHAGHVSLLRQARAACDRLVVGLNTDASVRRLKGDERPVNGEADRAAVLSALKSVDAVVLFGEDTPAELIAELMPEVLVKGADYTIDQVVGADVVTAAGGRVVLADLLPDRSTSGTISSLKASGA